ncbi:LTA synthase family protein [Niabella terrae]
MVYKANYYAVVIYRMFLVLVLFMICRLLFFGLNYPMFSQVTSADWTGILRGGLRFDIAALFYFESLPLLLMVLPIAPYWRQHSRYQRLIKWVFFICTGLALALNCIDCIYYRFTLRRTTFDVFREFQHEQNKGALAGRFLVDFWYVVLIFLALLALMAFLYNRLVPHRSKFQARLRYYVTAVVVMLLTVFLAVGGIRGDYRHSTRPITISNAGDYVKNPADIYLVLNTPFTFIRTTSLKGLKKVQYFSEAELETIYSPVHRPDPNQVFQKKNVVLILLESFGKEALGFYNKGLDGGQYQGYTTFLDSLAGQSLVFWNSFANGRKSIDAIPACIAGIPGSGSPFVLTPYVSDTIGGLAHILDREGYHSSFFHGAPNGSMGFSAITRLLGIQHYFGKTEFNDDTQYDGIWGIWDEPFFQFFARELNNFPQPFFSTIFSVSSHHPFKVPEDYQGVFKKGPLPVYECMGYTDMALRKFFEVASRQSWFNNTVFVISADHATTVYHEEYQNAWGEFAIPILLYVPGDSTMRGIRNTSIQQIDIPATVLGYLHYNKPFLSFGQNVLDSSHNRQQFVFQHSGEYRWWQGDTLLFSDGQQPKSLFDFKGDPGLSKNILDQQPDAGAALLRRLQAFIQQYNNRMIENRLTVGQ